LFVPKVWFGFSDHDATAKTSPLEVVRVVCAALVQFLLCGHAGDIQKLGVGRVLVGRTAQGATAQKREDTDNRWFPSVAAEAPQQKTCTTQSPRFAIN